MTAESVDISRALLAERCLFPHRALTAGTLVCAPLAVRRFALVLPLDHLGRSCVDIVFILVMAGLYAASHWIAWALSRLGSEP